ncbi:MAG: MEDS domain-containing protein [Candidatus Tantalella remota]|nr:MEDS domain-containing protein [Candidatus Tantalella remota]
MGNTNIEEVINFIEEMTGDKHICLVYGKEEELNNILVPYFGKGLINNEVCIWVFSGSTQMGDAKEALKMKIPDLDIYIEKGQMILLDNQDLYVKGGEFDPASVLQFWPEKKKQVLDKGFKALRVSGGGNWARGRQWIELAKYEELVNAFILENPMKAICTYSNKIAGLPEILSVGVHHSKLIIYQEGKWQILDATNARLLLEKLENPYLTDYFPLASPLIKPAHPLLHK